MRRFAVLIAAASFLLAAPQQAQAAEYSLKVANLLDDAFAYFVRGPVRKGEGEVALPTLEQALDTGDIGGGALLYDRDVYPAGTGIARAFGAVAVRPTGYSASEDAGLWRSISWEGKPGDRVVWVLRPATPHRQRVRHLALSGNGGGLHYFVPYGVSLSPRPLRAARYALAFLRSGEDGEPLWDRFLSRSVDLRGGLAALVGEDGSAGYWIYFVVEQPEEPTAFKAVVGWGKGPADRSQTHGGFGGVRAR